MDNLVTVAGGRYIGDEYFDADPDVAFADLDLQAIGPLIQEVTTSVDACGITFWKTTNSRNAI